MPYTHEKSAKNQGITEWYGSGKCGAIKKKNVVFVLPQSQSHGTV